MPKKFATENSKAVEAKARKAAAKAAADETKLKAEEEAFWADDDKNAQRKMQRKEGKVKKKMETVERKAQNRVIHDDEINAIAARQKVVPSTSSRLTRAQIIASLEEEPKSSKSPKELPEEPLQENVNHLVLEGLDARGLDEAIAILNVKPVELDRHPERRVKAAYDAFEQANLPRLKAENTNMRLSQLKQILKRDWMKSPDNPLNQRHAAYNERKAS